MKVNQDNKNGRKITTYILRLLLEFLDGTLVNTAAFVDHMSGGGGLAGVDVTDDDDVDMALFLAHFLQIKTER